MGNWKRVPISVDPPHTDIAREILQIPTTGRLWPVPPLAPSDLAVLIDGKLVNEWQQYSSREIEPPGPLTTLFDEYRDVVLSGMTVRREMREVQYSCAHWANEYDG